MRRFHLTWLIMAGILAPPSLRAQVADSIALGRLQVRPQVAVTVSQRNQAVTAAFDLYVQVVNLTANDLSLQRIKVVLPGDLRAARGLSPAESLSVSVGQMLKPGQQRVVSFYVPSGGALSIPLITFAPAEYDGQVVVTYRVPPEPETDHLEVFNFPLEPPLRSLLIGGVFGALLLSAFRAWGGYTKGSEAGNKGKAITQLLVTFIGGAITAIIVLFLIQRIDDLPLPVNIAVNDFFGAIIIGLLSYKLGEVLYNWLLGEKKSENPQEQQTREPSPR